jgi:hypothetical protein
MPQDSEHVQSRIAVLIPGIMGSTLTYQGKPLWTENIRENYAMIRRNSSLLRWTGERADAQLWKTVYLFGFPVAQLWAKTLSYLAGRKTLIPTVVECGYDWRMSLQDSCKDVLKHVEQQIGRKLDVPAATNDQRLVVITHSMGGLLIRVAIGSGRLHLSQVDRVIHFAPPLLGAPVAFRSLVASATLPFLNELMSFGRFKNYDKFLKMVYETFRTFPSLYELLPPVQVPFIRDSSYRRTNPLSESYLNPTMSTHAINTHAILAKADQDLYQANARVFSIFSEFNSDHTTDLEYRAQAVSAPESSYRILERWESAYGDGTVLAESAQFSIASESLPVSNVVHAYMPNTKTAVELLLACGV